MAEVRRRFRLDRFLIESQDRSYSKQIEGYDLSVNCFFAKKCMLLQRLYNYAIILFKSNYVE